MSASQEAFLVDTRTKEIGEIPGITVAPARCDGNGLITSAGTILGGDGSAVGASADGGTVVNDGSGAGDQE